MSIQKLPKKTIVIIYIIIVLGILSFFLVLNTKEKEVKKILYTLGYKEVKNILVFNKSESINEDTNNMGYRYSIKFNNLITHKNCRGFIWKDFKKNIKEDIKCNE